MKSYVKIKPGAQKGEVEQGSRIEVGTKDDNLLSQIPSPTVFQNLDSYENPYLVIARIIQARLELVYPEETEWLSQMREHLKKLESAESLYSLMRHLGNGKNLQDAKESTFNELSATLDGLGKEEA